jgi:CRISPR/Cas system-associated exonuclease Cas4 (RecB family)
MLEKCPLQYYLKYIVRLDGTEGDTLERDLGTLVHYVFERMYSGCSIDQAVQEALDKYGDSIPVENLHRVHDMIPNVRRFDYMMHEMDAGKVDLVIPEREVAIDREFNPVSFNDPNAYFRGIIDFSWRAGPNALLLDFKKGGGAFLTKYHTPQLASYILLEYCTSPFQEASSYIYYVEAGQLSKGPTLNAEGIERHTRGWLVNKIEDAKNAVKDAGIFMHKRGSHCKYCNYSTLCGKGRGCGDLTTYEQQSRSIYDESVQGQPGLLLIGS